jgi:uncharacterized protein (TIGR03435 family)
MIPMIPKFPKIPVKPRTPAPVTLLALTLVAFTLLAASPISGYAQSAAPASANDASTPLPRFDLVDVHVSEHSNTPTVRGGMLHGGRFSIQQATMTTLIARAYGLGNSYVLGGPPWLDLDRFDVVAASPRSTSSDDVRLMLRSMLADRFKLVLRPDTKPLPAYALTIAKGTPKLKQADTSADPTPSEPGEGPGCQFQPGPANTAPSPGMEIKFACYAESMSDFVKFLRDMASPYLRNPVVDQTGLKGVWDFDIRWSYQQPRGDNAAGTTIFDAVEKQLGLKLTATTTPLPVVMVESVNEIPTPNLPGIEKALPPPPPAAFDVAVIKPAAPEERGMQIQLQGSQLKINNADLNFLITWAWDISGGSIVNPPDFLGKDHWDILGKFAQDGPPTAPGAAPSVGFEDVQQMVKSLLADRFEMKSHTEDRPADGYALVAANPHLKKADPSNRTGCKSGPGPDGKDPRIDNPMLGRLMTCSNITMAQFAAQLQAMAPGFIKNQVIDATGIDGAYDFTLAFSTSAQLRGAAPSPSPPPDDPSSANAAPAPTGGISLFDAVYKTLGVKLEKRKTTVPMLVIDHIDPKPTEN